VGSPGCPLFYSRNMLYFLKNSFLLQIKTWQNKSWLKTAGALDWDLIKHAACFLPENCYTLLSTMDLLVL
jgi:hypothetical protein